MIRLKIGDKIVYSALHQLHYYQVTAVKNDGSRVWLDKYNEKGVLVDDDVVTDTIYVVSRAVIVDFFPWEPRKGMKKVIDSILE